MFVKRYYVFAVVLGWLRGPEGRVGQAPLEQISCPTYLKTEAVRRCSTL